MNLWAVTFGIVMVIAIGTGAWAWRVYLDYQHDRGVMEMKREQERQEAWGAREEKLLVLIGQRDETLLEAMTEAVKELLPKPPPDGEVKETPPEADPYSGVWMGQENVKDWTFEEIPDEGRGMTGGVYAGDKTVGGPDGISMIPGTPGYPFAAPVE